MPLTISLWAVLLLLATGAIALGSGRSRTNPAVIYGASLAICSVILLSAAVHLAADHSDIPHIVRLPIGLPMIGAHFRLDPLAAFFSIVVNLGGAVTSLYGLGYGRHETAPGRVLPFFPMFLAGMNIVILADDAFSFLFSWELMSLVSWALVMAHHREAGNARAGYVYLVTAAFGTLCLLLALGLLAGSGGGYTFEAVRQTHPAAGVARLVFALVLLGAGSKAGLVPLHVWLPLAHPAAPSHVSALMSGVMTKVALYAVIRIVFDLLGGPEWWWGAVVLTVGGLTAVLGVLYALMQHDLKRLLAYHTVENVGIITIGLGLALAFRANTQAAGAALALTAALFHILNHSLFKSLLFLGAGAVLAATGERDMERLGGVIHGMPLTAFTFLVGSAAISALPPLNGFVSEWLTFQAVLASPVLPQWLLKFLVPAVGALLALSAGLAAACFVKAFGITFLGRPRSPAAAAARETDKVSLAAMFALAGLCVLAGVLPGVVIDAIAPVVAQLDGGARLPAQTVQGWLTLVPVGPERSSYNGLVVLLFIALSSSITAFIVHRLGSRATRRGRAWDCGFPDASPATQYTAGSFAQPIRRVFGSVVFRARETVEMPLPSDPRPARFHVRLHDPAWEAIYQPVAGAIDAIATRLNYFQFLTIRRYLTLVFSALILLLVVLTLWQ